MSYAVKARLSCSRKNIEVLLRSKIKNFKILFHLIAKLIKNSTSADKNDMRSVKVMLKK